MRINSTASLLLLFFVLTFSGCSDTGDPVVREAAGQSPIEILVDNMGIPHIFADTDRNAFFASGYMIATDRLYQAAMLRRFALGRLSEVLEAANRDYIEGRHRKFLFGRDEIQANLRSRIVLQGE